MTTDLATAERAVTRDPEDRLARERLRVERERVGHCPDHDMPLSGTVHRTCVRCRALVERALDGFDVPLDVQVEVVNVEAT